MWFWFLLIAFCLVVHNFNSFSDDIYLSYLIKVMAIRLSFCKVTFFFVINNLFGEKFWDYINSLFLIKFSNYYYFFHLSFPFVWVWGSWIPILLMGYIQYDYYYDAQNVSEWVHGSPFRVPSVSFWHFLSSSMLSGTTGCARLILHFLCPASGISYFFKEL